MLREHRAGDDLGPRRAGSDAHSVPVSRRGRTNSSPVLRNARSTASSPSSSAMNVSSDRDPVDRVVLQARHCVDRTVERAMAASSGSPRRSARSSPAPTAASSIRDLASSARGPHAPGPRVMRYAPGQAEHTLRDDVALDLAGAARDRAAERPQVLDRPRSLAPHRADRACRGRPRPRRAPRCPAEAAPLHASLPNSLSSECSGRRLALAMNFEKPR